MPGAENKPIDTGLAFLLIGFGIVIDLLQAVLALLLIGELLDPAIDLLAMLGFAIMLHHHGGGAFKRRSVSFTLTSIAEFIPIIDALPFWTIFAIYTVVMDRMRHSSIGNSLSSESNSGAGTTAQKIREKRSAGTRPSLGGQHII